MFHYSKYWGTWSRILLHPGDMVGDRPFGAYLEVNLTPINGRYDNSTRELWMSEVAPVVLRTHRTVPQPGEMVELIPPMVVTAMIMNVGRDLTARLIADNILGEIDMPTLLGRMRGGGIPLSECNK